MALVESAGREIRCRRCRHQVLEEPPHRILEQEDQDNQEAANTLSICDDNLPPWIADAIEEVSEKKESHNLSKVSLVTSGCFSWFSMRVTAVHVK